MVQTKMALNLQLLQRTGASAVQHVAGVHMCSICMIQDLVLCHSPEHAAVQLVLWALEQQGRVHDWQIVSVQQDDFSEAGCI